MPSLNDSSDPVETSSTRTPSTGRSRQRGGDPDQHPDRAQVVVRAGHHGSRHQCRPSPRSPRRRTRCRRRAAGESPGSTRRRPLPARPRPCTGAGSCVPARACIRGAQLQRNPRQDRMEDQSRMRGVVVGDQHERPIGIRVADLRHHVPGRAMGERRAAEPATAVAEVVPQRGGADAGDGCRERAGQALRRLRRASTPPMAAASVDQADRPPVAAVGALLLDLGPASERFESRRRSTRRRGARLRTRMAGRTPRARGSPPASRRRGWQFSVIGPVLHPG